MKRSATNLSVFVVDAILINRKTVKETVTKLERARGGYLGSTGDEGRTKLR